MHAKPDCLFIYRHLNHMDLEQRESVDIVAHLDARQHDHFMQHNRNCREYMHCDGFDGSGFAGHGYDPHNQHPNGARRRRVPVGIFLLALINRRGRLDIHRPRRP